jgi:hypothetical protein
MRLLGYPFICFFLLILCWPPLSHHAHVLQASSPLYRQEALAIQESFFQSLLDIHHSRRLFIVKIFPVLRHFLLAPRRTRDLRVTVLGLMTLKKAGFDLVQFLREGHAVYTPLGGGQLLFRLKLGKTKAIPRHQYNFSKVLAGVSIDVFDLEASGDQWVGRADKIIALHQEEPTGIEATTGGIYIQPNQMISDDALEKRYPSLTRRSLVRASIEHVLTKMLVAYALWIEPAYRNKHYESGGFTGIGATLVGLNDLAAMTFFGIKRTIFGFGKEADGFHKSRGIRFLNDPKWGLLWERQAGPYIHFVRIQNLAKEPPSSRTGEPSALMKKVGGRPSSTRDYPQTTSLFSAA